jgi:hypothetical protein
MQSHQRHCKRVQRDARRQEPSDARQVPESTRARARAIVRDCDVVNAGSANDDSDNDVDDDAATYVDENGDVVLRLPTVDNVIVELKPERESIEPLDDEALTG